jgi:hypothetical protein
MESLPWLLVKIPRVDQIVIATAYNACYDSNLELRCAFLNCVSSGECGAKPASRFGAMGRISV